MQGSLLASPRTAFSLSQRTHGSRRDSHRCSRIVPAATASRHAVPSQQEASSNAVEPGKALSRRGLLQAVVAAPLVWEAVAGAATPPPAHAAAGAPRSLTPAERKALDEAFAATIPKIKAPVMLRLPFHDAGTYSSAAACGGANASVQFELARPENFGLNRGWSVIKATRQKLAGTAAEALSDADLIALAGAHAVAITGGPRIEVPVGRVDAEGPDPEGHLPMETLSAEEQIANFEDKGLSVQELIALAGAHTLGNKGFGEPLLFDNTYYRSLLEKPWLDKSNPMGEHIGIPSDRVLPDNPATRPVIERYAADQQLFFDDFAAAYVKLTSLGAAWA